MTATVPEASALHEEMLGALDEALGSQQHYAEWRTALAAIARHVFIPAEIWVEHDDPPPTLVPLHRDDDPGGWLRRSYCPTEPVLTQLDHGVPTSSASAPVVVAQMLCALDVTPGQRVLEIGTGTGYNVALLAHRLGQQQVTTIEIDPELAKRARRTLGALRYDRLSVVTGDGTFGYSPHAPYDRILATVACRQVPYHWVAQTIPDGRIITPWSGTYTGGLLALTVAEDGTASGPFIGDVDFMVLRAHQGRCGSVADVVGNTEAHAERSTTILPPYWVTGPLGVRLAISQRVPDCRWRYWPWDEAEQAGTLWLLDSRSHSWAKLVHVTQDANDGEFAVFQHGPRRLWDEVSDAYRWWCDQGRPGADQWRVTVTRDAQLIALDSMSPNAATAAGAHA